VPIINCVPDHLNQRGPWRLVVRVYDKHEGLSEDDAAVGYVDNKFKVFVPDAAEYAAGSSAPKAGGDERGVARGENSELHELRRLVAVLKQDKGELLREQGLLKQRYTELQRIASQRDMETPIPKEGSCSLQATAVSAGASMQERGAGAVLSSDIGAIHVHERLTTPLAWDYSTLQCLGPASTSGIQSRVQHPHPGISEEDIRTGLETEHGGGPRQRVCRIRNACVTSLDPSIHLHFDPTVEDIDLEFLKADAYEGLGSRFVQLDTHFDSTLLGETALASFKVHRSSIR
jgi:hypothetical protein